MERKIYKIEIHGNVNDYVYGRISGVIDALCGSDVKYPHRLLCDVSRWPWRKGRIEAVEIAMNATEEEFRKIKTTIEKIYPKLCTFYIKKG